jgi:hypothetical protein
VQIFKENNHFILPDIKNKTAPPAVRYCKPVVYTEWYQDGEKSHFSPS